MIEIFLSAGALITLLLCFPGLYYHFPHNTVRIPLPLLLPLALLITLLAQAPLALIVLFILPEYCFDLLKSTSLIFEYARSSWKATGLIVAALVYFCVSPGVLSLLFFRSLRNAWELNKKLCRRYSNPEDFRKYFKNTRIKELPYKKVADFVEKYILHPIAVLASYPDSREEVMIDVKTTDGFLFSGKLSQYFCNGAELISISQTNILKFDLRKPDSKPTMYMVPNSGEMYFPKDKIQDLHFWRLKKSMKVLIALNSIEMAARFAWICSLQKALPHMNIKITAYKPPDDREDIRKEIVYQLRKCGLKPQDVTVEFLAVGTRDS